MRVALFAAWLDWRVDECYVEGPAVKTEQQLLKC